MGKRKARKHFDPHRPVTAYGVLDELVGYAIRRAQLVITEAFDARFGALGITTQRFSALVLIAENPGLKQTELAEMMGIARSGALAIVAALEQQGWVMRGANAADQRAQALTLAPAGEEFVPRLIRQIRAFDAELTQSLSPSERDALLRLSRRIGVTAGC